MEKVTFVQEGWHGVTLYGLFLYTTSFYRSPVIITCASDVAFANVQYEFDVMSRRACVRAGFETRIDFGVRFKNTYPGLSPRDVLLLEILGYVLNIMKICRYNLFQIQAFTGKSTFILSMPNLILIRQVPKVISTVTGMQDKWNRAATGLSNVANIFPSLIIDFDPPFPYPSLIYNQNITFLEMIYT